MRTTLLAGLAVAAMACDGPPEQTHVPHTGTAAQGAAPTAQTPPMEPMSGFSWVVPDSLAAMPRPGVRRALAEDLAFLRAEGVDVIVSLTEEPLEANPGFQTLHLPVRDFTPPTLQQMQQFAAAMDGWDHEGKRVAVHCTAGLGRTGTLLAATFVHRGMTAADAIAHIRTLRPGSIETRAQEESVAAFEAFVRRDATPPVDR